MNWSLLRWLLKSWWFAEIGGESLRGVFGVESELVGGFSPTHLKNMLMLVKLDHETPSFGMNIQKIFELPPASDLGRVCTDVHRVSYR